MMWNAWIDGFVRDHSLARGLQTGTVAVYRRAVEQFAGYVRFRLQKGPDEISQRDILDYLEKYLRGERQNCQRVVGWHVVVLRTFYKAAVALGLLEPARNPLAHFPKMKAAPMKLPEPLSRGEQERLLDAPPEDEALGLRDRAVLLLLDKTGIRASECASLKVSTVDLDERRIKVIAKGGHERVVPIPQDVAAAMRVYLDQRSRREEVPPNAPFFVARKGKAMNRKCIYDRVRKWSIAAGIQRRVTPHTLRHTCATELVKQGEHIAVIRDLLGHKWISSTQIYLHVTAQDLRQAIDRHPIDRLRSIVSFLPDVVLPWQRVAPPRRDTG